MPHTHTRARAHARAHTHTHTHTHTYIMQNIPIPTMDTGAEVAKRFYKELTDIQVYTA